MFGQSLLSAFGSAACTTDTNQLFATDVQTTSVATYQFNNATTSIPSNTYPGTPSSITYAAGKFGNAAVFNGSTSNIDFTSPIPYTNTDLTFSCWIKLDSAFSSGLKTIIGAGDKSTGEGIIRLSVRYDSANSYKIEPVRSYSGNTYYDASSNYAAQTINAGSWYNIIYTYSASGNTAKIYINGSLVSTTSLTTTSTDNTNSGVLSLGQYRDGVSSASFWDGSIDQVRIFNTALPQAAVTALYNETTTTATYPYVTSEVANPNSVAYYKMSDATDQLGNYNGTATNVNFNTEGKFGFAGAFNGSSSVVNLNSAILPTDIFSVSLWINVTTLQDNKWIFSQYTAGVSARFVFNYNAGGDLQLTIGGSGNFFTSTGAISANTWHNIVVVKNASSGWKIYVDGSNVGSWNSTANIMTSNNTALGGRIDGATTNTILGSLDQIRIYDSALSAANVTTLYEEIECPAVTSDTYLVVGGGAGSGSYGGGGAGGYLSNFNRNSIEFTTGTVYTITVGAGGATSSSGGSAGTNGDASVLSGSNITTITASGGGYGGNLVSNINANSGASGGGGASDGAGAGGAASPAGQGNAGGIGAAGHPNYSGGGGGGAGAIGNAGSGATGGNGGVGIETSITGTATYFAGGGGGTGYAYPNPGTSGTGGSGGGGTANPYGSTSTVSNATPNTGGGGGGNGAVYSNGSGGSGIVVLRYSSTKSITIASGSLSTGTLNTSIGSDKYTTFIGGTGTVTFS